MVCPLDWGLGHATRCVPVIRNLLDAGARVVVGADKGPLAFLQMEFPDLLFVRFPGYRFRYPGKGSMAVRMLLSGPAIFEGIRQEHKLLGKIIHEKKVDAVISDNRFGLWSGEIPSIFMTHQIFIRATGIWKPLEGLLYSLNRRYISRYKECWIPDWEDSPNLSGDLSHKSKLPGSFHFIGPLSRFEKSRYNDTENGFDTDIFVMLSGPEPQRSILEEIVFGQLEHIEKKVVVIRGIAGEERTFTIGKHASVYNHLDTATLSKYLERARLIVCRPGYSTLMDLAALGKRAVVVPTPGQTEQEYLAVHLSQKGGFVTYRQENLNLESLQTDEITELPHGVRSNDFGLLRERIGHLIKICRPQT